MTPHDLFVVLALLCVGVFGFFEGYQQGQRYGACAVRCGPDKVVLEATALTCSCGLP